MTLDDIIMESEDEIEHSHMPNPTEDKINKVGKCVDHVIFEVLKLASNIEIFGQILDICSFFNFQLKQLRPNFAFWSTFFKMP